MECGRSNSERSCMWWSWKIYSPSCHRRFLPP